MKTCLGPVLGLLLALVTVAAQAITPAELQRLLQSAPPREVPFHELRESPWLDAPVSSRGTLSSTPQVLEKRVSAPRSETWRLYADRVEWTGADGSRKTLSFAQAPAIGVLADALRRVVAGDLDALARDYRMELQGNEQRWHVQLVPRDGDLARYIAHLELQGQGASLQVIIVVEAQGGRSTTRLGH
jgi:hypothetical protein